MVKCSGTAFSVIEASNFFSFPVYRFLSKMASKRTSKKPISKIPPKTAERIVAISLRHPELGARRLVALLKKKRISVSAATIQSILRREGLQSHERRLAKLKAKSKRPKRQSKKPSLRVTDKVAERIVEISLQNPDFGARRLLPMLKKEKVRIPASKVYAVLKRHGLQSRAARVTKLEERKKAARKPKSPPKKPATKISDDVAERIVEISLQNPDFGAKRLVPLLKKAGIRVTSSAVYRILKRRGLQTSEKRLAKATETSAEPIYIPKKFPEKIPPEVEDRIVELSLQNYDYGARRLTPLLQQEEIFVSASAVYTILKRNNVENRQKRLLKLEERQALETPPAPEAEGPAPVPEKLKIELPPAVDEVPEAVFEPAVVVPMPPGDEMSVSADLPEPGPAVVAPVEPEGPPLRKAPVKPIKKMGNWVFYPLYLLLFILIGFLGFHAFQAIQTARVETKAGTAAESATVGIAARPERSASVRPLAGYRQIWKRNLFNTGKVKEPDSEKKISLDKLALAKKDLGLELVGTVVADDPKLSRAIIDNRGIKKQEAYREGDTAGKVKIKKILRNNVVITTAKGDELLTVEIKESGKRATSYSPARQVGSSSSSKQQTPGKPRSSARISSISLKRNEVEDSLADIDGLKEQVRLSPYMQGDEPAGFRLGNIPRDSVLRKMGLRSRDVIIGMDEESITSPDQASDFFQKLAEGGEVTIKIKRRRRTRQIRLNIE
jgi:general secretion pathway protein C